MFFTISKRGRKMLELHKIQEMLKDRRLTVVADRCGLSYPTVKHVADGGKNVTLATMTKLSDYLKGDLNE
jgi:DNA-binding Xre family transcriptional regulator